MWVLPSVVFPVVASIWNSSHVTLGSGFCPPATQVSACISGLTFRLSTLTHALGLFWCQIPAPGGPPPHHLPSVSHLSNLPLGRPLWVPPFLEPLSWEYCVSVNVCVAGSGCLLPSVWKLTEGRGYGQFCSHPCSRRTWCLMTIYIV